MKQQTAISMIKILIAVLLLTFSIQCRAKGNTKIVSLDLCTDWMLLKYASHSHNITYSPLLYRYKVDWVTDNLPVHDGSLEQILELQPDLILTGEYNATLLTKRLRQLGLNTEVMPLPFSLQSIIDYTKQFKSLVSTSQSLNLQLLIPEFEPSEDKLLLLGANGIGTGTGTLEHDIIVKSGWSNYIDVAGFVSLNLEKMVTDPPDAVLWTKPVSNSLANNFASHRVLKDLIAHRNLNMADSWRWQCPGPWTFELITELAAWKNH